MFGPVINIPYGVHLRLASSRPMPVNFSVLNSLKSLRNLYDYSLKLYEIFTNLSPRLGYRSQQRMRKGLPDVVGSLLTAGLRKAVYGTYQRAEQR